MSFFTIPEPLMEEFYKGDPKCTHSIGTLVFKNLEIKCDIHSAGTGGTVTGSKYLNGIETYLVRFHTDVADTFILGHKLTTNEDPGN